jgi:hypothetical protein
MRAETTLRPALNPRSLAIASGERLPEGHSTTARMFSVAVAPGAIEQRQLTVAQEQRHHYPLALAVYLRSLAEQFADLQERLPQRFRELRAELQVAGTHRREPGQLAHLLLGLETFLDFAVEIGAITSNVRETHLKQARDMLLRQAQEHAATQAEEAPERLFLRYLAGGFAGKRAYLEDKQGDVPVAPELWGWERAALDDSFGTAQEAWRHASTAHLVGVLDSDWLLLFPEQVYQFIVGAAKAAARTFPVDLNTLIRRLDEAKLIATETEGDARRRKVNVWIGGATKRVIKLRRDAVVASSGEDREEWEGREDPPAPRGNQDVPPSWSVGNATATGKDFSANDDAVAPFLPGLPTLPGVAGESDATGTESEELVEWRG